MKIKKSIQRFFKKDDGVSFLEFSLLVICITVFVVLAGPKLATHLGGAVSATNTQIESGITTLQTEVQGININ